MSHFIAERIKDVEPFPGRVMMDKAKVLEKKGEKIINTRLWERPLIYGWKAVTKRVEFSSFMAIGVYDQELPIRLELEATKFKRRQMIRKQYQLYGKQVLA